MMGSKNWINEIHFRTITNIYKDWHKGCQCWCCECQHNNYLRGGGTFHMTGTGDRLGKKLWMNPPRVWVTSHTLHHGCKSIPQGDYYDPLQIFSLSEQYFKQHEKYIFFRLRNVYVCCWENRLLGYQFQNQILFGFDLVYKYTSNNPAFLLNFIADPPCWNIWFAIPLWSAIRTLKIFETSQHIMLDWAQQSTIPKQKLSNDQFTSFYQSIYVNI